MPSLAGHPVYDSADSEWVLFTSNRSGNGDIYGFNPVTGEERFIAGNEKNGDGALRYYAPKDHVYWTRNEDNRAMIMSLDAEIMEDPSSDVAPKWSADGKYYAYARREDGRDRIYLAARPAPDQWIQERVSEKGYSAQYPDFSPNSKTLAYVRRDGDSSAIVLMNMASRKKIVVLERFGYIGHLAFSPDGSKIAFDMRYDGDTEIAVLDRKTEEVTRLTTRVGNDLIPAWSLDGSRIYFGGEISEENNWEIWSVGLDDKRIRRHTRNPGFDGGPLIVRQSAFDPIFAK